MDRIYTGFESLDKHLKICKGDLVVIGGRPATGKTAFLISILVNLAKNNFKCKFFSLELYEKDLKEKISKSVGYDIEREKKIFSYTSIDDEMILTKEILDSKINNNIQIVLIDYLQLLDVNGSTTKEKIRALRNIAKQKNIVIFVASQISKVFECYNIPPKISAEWLLDKKRIWENFDMADIDKFIFIDRPDRRLSFEEMFANEINIDSADFIIVKNNNGNTGNVKCGWDRSTYTFNEIPKAP